MEDKKEINIFARNGQGSEILYVARKNFKQDNRPMVNDINVIDLWYEKPFYGRIDNENDFVFVSESGFKSLSEKEKTLFAIDFVVDAFNDMKNYTKKAQIQQQIFSESPLAKLEIKKAWQSVNISHHSHINRIYEIFISQYVQGNKNIENNIISIKDFVNNFVSFLGVAKEINFTRTGFLKSKQCPLNVSGLMLEIDGNYANDMGKDKLLRDPNFKFFLFALRKFGFAIDVNNPNRIVANVSSPQMWKYMEKYGVSKNSENLTDMFEIYFYKAYSKDLEIMKSYLVQMYNSFVKSFPKTKCKNKKRRKVVNEQQVLGNDFWLSKYFEIRCVEGQKDYNLFKINQEKQKIFAMKEKFDIDEVLCYINSVTK